MRRTLAVSLFALVCSTAMHAQAVVGSGAITGLVKDIYGDGIPDTTVTLTNKVMGVKRTMMTSDNGVFDLLADLLDLAERPGFLLPLGGQARVLFLQVGELLFGFLALLFVGENAGSLRSLVVESKRAAEQGGE